MASYLDGVPFSGIIRIRDMMYSVANPYRLDQGDVSFDSPDSVKAGMTRAIADNHSHYVQTTGIPRLRLIPVGRQREMSAEYFSSFRMRALIDSLRSRYPDRYLFIDGPAVKGSPECQVTPWRRCKTQVVSFELSHFSARSGVGVKSSLVATRPLNASSRTRKPEVFLGRRGSRVSASTSRPTRKVPPRRA